MGVLEDGGKPTELSLLQCLLFGCIISAVDPVAVLAIFQEVLIRDFIVLGFVLSTSNPLKGSGSVNFRAIME